MTQTQPDRVDQLEALIERVDRKLDRIAADHVDMKVLLARIDERLNSSDTQMSDFKKSTDSQFADFKKSTDSQFADLRKSTDSQFADLRKSTDSQFADIKIQIRAQDSRLWTFITALILAVVGLLTKFLFFPQA
jgi:hypothetical protein